MSKPESNEIMLNEDAWEDSLSINTSDAECIQSEYYLDEAIEKKVTSMNKHFEDRMEFMTKIIVDRIEESSSSDECQTKGFEKLSKRKYLEAFKDTNSCLKRKKLSEHEPNYPHENKWINEGFSNVREQNINFKIKEPKVPKSLKGSKRKRIEMERQELEIEASFQQHLNNVNVNYNFIKNWEKYNWSKKLRQANPYQSDSSED